MNTFDIYDLKENKFLNLSINIDEAKAEKKKSNSYIIVPDIYKNIENGNIYAIYSKTPLIYPKLSIKLNVKILPNKSC